MRATILLASLLALTAAGAPFAAEIKPCEAEVERFCPGVQPGGGRIRACMRANFAQLSPGCRAHVASAARRLRGEEAPRMVLACKADIESLCRSVPAGDGRWRRCLDDHADQLSGPCRTLLDGIARR